MSTHSHPTDEERSPEGGDNAQITSDIVKEFKHTDFGVWDVYEHIPRRKFGVDIPNGMSALIPFVRIIGCLPLAWRAAKDVTKIAPCSYRSGLFVLFKFLVSLIPVVELWFASHFITIVRVAVDKHRIDENLLIYSSTGAICCKMAAAFLRQWKQKIGFSLAPLVQEHFCKEVFSIMADLDVPTRSGNGIDGVSEHGIFDSLSAVLDLIFSSVCFVAKICVLATVIGHQQNGTTFVVVHLCLGVFVSFGTRGEIFSHRPPWIATINNEHYIKICGLEKLVESAKHRQEIVAGNLAESLKAAYNLAYTHVSGKRTEWREIYLRSRNSRLRYILPVLFSTPVKQAAEVAYLLKSAGHPETIPERLAIIVFIHMISESLMHELLDIIRQAQGAFEFTFYRILRFHQLREIRNKIPDGTIPFPEGGQPLASGIAVEFRNVSFRYPGDEGDFVLRNVSFKVEKGQLCVIVGRNGSGKSTILKLILRLYDPTEGTILVNGQDIKTFKLADLRESMVVLFQDYTHFPLSIKDNIALGDPRNADDEARIREAARLGGAREFIEKMAKGFNSYPESPVSDHLEQLSWIERRSKAKIDRKSFRKAFGCTISHDPNKLAGGQMQRLAVSRMFMRLVFPEEGRVGLLLLDEPSAALDPVAEHDLFTRLQEMRGGKTMIFSSHRFGHLTKPADLILYMDNSTIVECGSHNELMTRGGKYAESWNLQVKGFS